MGRIKLIYLIYLEEALRINSEIGGIRTLAFISSGGVEIE